MTIIMTDNQEWKKNTILGRKTEHTNSNTYASD